MLFMKKVLTGVSILVASLCMLSIFLYFNVSASVNLKGVYSQQTSTELPKSQERLLNLLNNEREKHGAAPLTIETKLMESAQWKADKMLRTGNNAHIDPETGKNDGLVYLTSLRPPCSIIGENLSWSTDKAYTLTSEDAVYWWMDSTPHRQAILNSRYVSVGFGVTDHTIVAHFCQP